MCKKISHFQTRGDICEGLKRMRRNLSGRRGGEGIQGRGNSRRAKEWRCDRAAQENSVAGMGCLVGPEV